MNGANIGSCAILLNGPSSAGKSSIAEVLRKKLDEAGLTVRVISIDDYMKISTDEEIWEDDVYETVPEMSRDISAAVGRGETVIIDHAITSKRIFDAMIASAAGGGLKTVLVECSAEVLRQREAERGNRFAGSAEASLKYLYPKDGYDLTVNTEKKTAEGCAAEIIGAFFEADRKEGKNMKDLIAFCGLDCEACDARIATVNNDDTLRAKTAKLWSELNNTEITPQMINCEGCRVDGVKTLFCGSLCQIRQCALGREVETCGSCPEMDSCKKLNMITGNNEEARNNLKS